MKAVKNEPKKKTAVKSKLPKEKNGKKNKKAEKEAKPLTQEEQNEWDRIKYKDHVFFGYRINKKYKFLSFTDHKKQGYCLRNDLTNSVVMGCTTHSDYNDVLVGLAGSPFKKCKPMPVVDFI